MSLGERCDEIVRLIDETLAALGAPPTTPLRTSSTGAGAVAPARPRPRGMTRLTWDDVLGRAPADTDPPEREAAGF